MGSEFKLAMKMVKAKQEKVYAIVLGQQNSNILLHRITAEQCGVKHSRILPGISLFINPLNGHLLMTGAMGVDAELVDQD